MLMPDPVHLVLVPDDEDGLRRALPPTHRRYVGLIHARETRSGRFWQGRFGSVAMDDDHLAAMSERQRKAARAGRPIGSTAFVADLETLSGRRLPPGKSGPKRKVDG